MPYIRKESRDKLDPVLDSLIKIFIAHIPKEKQRACASYVVMKFMRYIFGKDIDGIFDMKGVMMQTYDEIDHRYSEPLEKIIVTDDFFDETHEELK